MDALDLNRLHVLDGLIYGLQVDTMSQTATLTIQIDAELNKGACEAVGVEASGRVLLDFAFAGVTAAFFEGMLPRGTAAPDEPPHEYEISTWKVEKRAFRKGQYRLEVRCYNSPRCSIEFNTVDVVRSSRALGVVHDYEAEAASKKGAQG